MKKLLIALAACASLVASAQTRDFTASQKLRYAEGIIYNFYVEPVDEDSLVEEGIKAMLSTLDPHSQFSSPEETRELNQPLEGKFSGIGIMFNIVQDTVYVIQTTVGGPSEKVGIRPGDRIISANDTIIAGKKLKNTDILKILRGPKGSQVSLKVKRGGVPDYITFLLKRDDIPIYSVDDAYMANDSVGYIRISRFAEGTAEEVAQAAAKLRKKGMKHVILDLEDNTGGYLGAAVQLASQFLPKGAPVVSTKGLRVEPMTFSVETEDGDLAGRVVLMVNQYSASASEILAGAMQDNDRGLVVGRRTYGKGLVQRPFPFPDGSMIRLTTARYYTPSGRCIQKPYEKGHGDEYRLDMLNRYNSGELWSADSIHFEDSLKVYTLKNHRTVYGGGGIMPDVFVPVDTTYFTPYYRDLVAKGIVNTFILSEVDKRRKSLLTRYPTEDDFQERFEVDKAMEERLIEAASEDGLKFNEEEWTRSGVYVRAILKGLMARDLYDKGSYVRSTNNLNPVFVSALELIIDPERYEALIKRQD
ncbi:MAG: S41 family peptidase [Muribaculaceae bacterium]|nr:S41 family peptidase [Muribaculaceae bacterium]